MESIRIITASNPRCSAGDKNTITLDVIFSHLDDVVEFTARRDDCEIHGRELYYRAMFGEFGDIIEIEKPSISEVELHTYINSEIRRVSSIMAPLEDAEKLGIIIDSEKALLTSFRQYRVSLYRLPQSDGWPDRVIFPDTPSI